MKFGAVNPINFYKGDPYLKRFTPLESYVDSE